MSAIDEYLKNATPSQKAMLERFRKIIKQIVPEAEEVISYGIPMFKYNETYLIYFAFFKNHMSIYPASDAMIKAIGPELAKFRTSKGTLQFTEDSPIPEPILSKIILFRLADITKSSKRKA